MHWPLGLRIVVHVMLQSANVVPLKRKRTWKRMAKKDRRNLKMWAEGARESILKPHIPVYTDALERGWRSERDYVQGANTKPNVSRYGRRAPWGSTENTSIAEGVAPVYRLLAVKLSRDQSRVRWSSTGSTGVLDPLESTCGGDKKQHANGALVKT
ncbi:hypothetical protein GGX14DRAFT_402308 [Mycena pura]|uniref:Uncharacterized protein n=1 Tax=Mycena pura TaxID=153505 RepID=A0AAD6Y7J5_9AGAR|nr:hypothetical protein GGX14DRAFT_402308 [Mycena pura]